MTRERGERSWLSWGRWSRALAVASSESMNARGIRASRRWTKGCCSGHCTPRGAFRAHGGPTRGPSGVAASRLLLSLML